MYKKLIDWSRSEHAQLPWRKKRTMYRTLVSEIMLQQTTVQTVLNKFDQFLKVFPSLKSLALASEEEVLIEWKGLGYYRRARNLKKACEYILEHHGGKFPKTIDELKLIPGVGEYTANALVAIGKDERALAIDANIERVISRIYGLKTHKGPKLQKEIRDLFEKDKVLKGVQEYRDINEALMDLGREFCKANQAYCENCFLAKKCAALQTGKPLNYPVQDSSKKKQEKHELSLLRVIIEEKDSFYCYKKKTGEWLENQFEIPTFIISSTDYSLKQYPKVKFDIKKLPSYKTTITKYKISNYIIRMNKSQFKKEFNFKRKLEPRDLDKGNLSTASIKAIKKSREEE